MASSNTSHMFTGLINGTSYTFWVRAVNAAGNGVAASVAATLTVVVSNITGLPATVRTGMSLGLSGIVQPANATNKNINWTVHDAGSTWAYFTRNVLYTFMPGTVIIQASITDGLGTGLNYLQYFEITVSDFAPFIEMVWVPSGSFHMGRELGTGSDVTPVHLVTLNGYYMGKYPVTQELYLEVMGNDPSNNSNPWFFDVLYCLK